MVPSLLEWEDSKVGQGHLRGRLPNRSDDSPSMHSSTIFPSMFLEFSQNAQGSLNFSHNPGAFPELS